MISVSCVSQAFASVHCCLVVTYWERADQLALVSDVYCILLLSHVVSWVRCGTSLLRFLIFAAFLTFNRPKYILPFLSKTVPQHFITWFLIAVRQEVKRIDNSVVVHALELAKTRDRVGVLYEIQVTSIT